MKKGIIISLCANVFKVYSQNEVMEISPRGSLRHKKQNILVGDYVYFDENNKTLEEVLPRTNSLFRPRIANIDLGIVVVSVLNPSFSSFLLDKFLTLLNMYQITPLVILTKVDLLSNEKKVEEILENYQKLGVEVIPYSQVTSLNLSLIKEKIKGKVIAFMGQTGVGKSSLINQIDPDFKRAIGEYSSLLGRGKHQTKEVILLPYGGGFIADTPGFSSLELPIFKEDLAKYFPGFNFPQTCKFTNCLHLSESTCCIKDKVKNGEISQENYQNYVDMSQELIFRKDRY